MAKEKTFCKNSVTSPKGILTQKEQGIRPALFALMCDKREKSCKSALLAVVADQIESQQNNSSYDSDDVSNTHDKILLNISYSLRVWNPVKIYQHNINALSSLLNQKHAENRAKSLTNPSKCANKLQILLEYINFALISCILMLTGFYAVIPAKAS